MTSTAAEPAHRRVPVLMWHHVGAAPTRRLAPYCIPPETLATQLDALAAAGCTPVTFDDLRAGTPAARPVVLTFDDGYRSFYDHAVPLLHERGMRAVAFVIAGQLGGVNDWDRGATDLDLMEEEEVAALARHGHEVGAHGWRHRPMPQLPLDRLHRELLACRALLETVVGRPVRTLSYPFGSATAAIARTAADSGFDVGCLDWRDAGADWPAGLGVTRVEVRPDTDPDTLTGWVAEHAGDLAVPRPPGPDPLAALAMATPAAADRSQDPAAGWAAVHAAAGPLTVVLRRRDAVLPTQPFQQVVGSAAAPAGPLARALAPVAAGLDAALARLPAGPVWSVATPADARATASQVHLAPAWSDVARLLWQTPAGRRDGAVAGYLRAAGRRHGRRAVSRARQEVALAEAGMVCHDAVEGTGAWADAERSVRALRPGAEDPGRYVEHHPPRARWLRADRALRALVRQRLREEYSGSLGLAWAVVQPIVLFTVLALFFDRVGIVHRPHYPQFLVAALVPWIFFQRSLSECVGCLRDGGHLLRLAAIPTVVLPLTAIAAAATDLGAQVAVMSPILMSTTGVSPARLPVLVPALAGLLAFTTAAGILVSGLAARYRDVAHAVPFLLGIGFYAVPVVYGMQSVPGHLRGWYWLNPVATVLTLFRDALYGGPWPPAGALVWAAVVCVAGTWAAARWLGSVSDDLMAEI